MANEFMSKSGAPVVCSFRTKLMVFFLLPSQAMSLTLDRNISLVERNWSNEIEVTIHIPSPAPILTWWRYGYEIHRFSSQNQRSQLSLLRLKYYVHEFASYRVGLRHRFCAHHCSRNNLTIIRITQDIVVYMWSDTRYSSTQWISTWVCRVYNSVNLEFNDGMDRQIESAIETRMAGNGMENARRTSDNTCGG